MIFEVDSVDLVVIFGNRVNELSNALTCFSAMQPSVNPKDAAMQSGNPLVSAGLLHCNM